MIAAALAVVIVFSAAGDQDPSGEIAFSLWHPSAVGSPLVGQYRMSSPLSGLSFPHLHATASQARLSFGGGGVVGTGAAGGAAGLIVPGRRAVWNGAVAVLGDDQGFFGRGVVSLARPLGSRLSGGAGGGLTVVESDSGVRVGAGVDLGVQYDLGAFRDVSRVDLHLAFLNIGGPLRRNDYDPLVPAFSPVAGARARVIQQDSVQLDLAGSIRAPGFSRIGYDLGAALVFTDGPTFRLGWRDTFGREEGRVWPGVSVGMRIPLGPGEDARETEVYGSIQLDEDANTLLAAEVSTGLESTDQEPPRISLSVIEPRREKESHAFGSARRYPDAILLSPVGYDAQLEARIGAVDNRGIRDVTVRIVDEQDETVQSRRFAPVGSTVPTGTPAERISSDLWQRKITGTFHWDVFENVPDGVYRLEVIARDRAGNTATAPPVEILVDGTAPYMEASIVSVSAEGAVTGPTVTVGPDDPVSDEEIRIAPEEDVEFSLLYRDAERLSLQVIDQAGRVLVPLSAQPDTRGEDRILTVRWPGTERDGSRIPEGVYRIQAEAGDEFGNETVVTSPPLLIQSIRPRFTLALSDTIVAPTGDGNRDTLTVVPRLEPITGLEEWLIELVDDRGDTVRRWSGIDLPPEAIVLGRRDFPQDGSYHVTAVSRYRNGTVAGDRTDTILVDTSPPDVDLVLERTRIQPDIDPVLRVFLEPDPDSVVTKLVVSEVADHRDSEDSPERMIVREWSRAPQRYDWRLLLEDGTFLNPGTYKMALEAWDAAGNRGTSPSRTVTLLERLQGVGIVPEREVFGPTGNGRYDTLRLSLAGSEFTLGEGEFEVLLLDDDDVIRRFSGTLPLPPAVEWDGRDGAGLPVPDGEYRAHLLVTVPDRGTVESTSVSFSVDTTPPEVDLLVSPMIVSPDGDGRQDELMIRPVLSQPGESRYRLFRDGEEMRARLPAPEAGPVAWDPRLRDGTVLPDGSYRLVLELEDEAGNIGRAEAGPITIDTRPVSGFVRISTPRFSPGSEDAPVATFTPVLPVVEGLERWEFLIEPDHGGEPVVIRRGGSGVLPPPVQWDGGGPDSQTVVPDGEYRGVLRARYRHGPVVDVTSPPVQVDATPPDVSVTLEPQPFSPDGDGIDDTLEFLVQVEDESPIQFWILEIFDPRGEFFYDVGGRGEPPGRIRWDGRTRTGELVVSAEEYPWRLEVSDVLGNTTVTEGTLLVDVLVEPFGEGYRIQLPSITFPPNSANLEMDPRTDAGEKNRTVLQRLVEILQRFPDYRILVEGHAVNVSGTEREQREELIPLSRERAAAVRDALIEFGVPARLLSAEGRGGAAPVVPHTDTVNRWKNRRVDFVLER